MSENEVTTEPEIVIERRGAVLIVRINRPEARNAMNMTVMAGIGQAMDEADSTADIRAVVLTGTGDRAFCAGMDLRAFAGGEMSMSEDDIAAMASFNRFMRGGVVTPVIGAANASAVAGGFELLMSCDMIVAAEGSKIGLPEVKRGLFAAGGGVFISQRIPIAIALELTLTGDTIDVAEAARMGLVNKVVPAESVIDEAVALAERIAANGPLGVQATKRLVRAAASEPTADVWALQAELQPGVFGSDDAKEGATAFVEKRPPVWTGR
jgi:enoyl-CoA hydratase/carnithine racemase